MKQEIKLVFYSDPGHGWLRVPLKMLTKLAIADKISPFSYVRTNYAYLEEDGDLSIFMEAVRSRGGRVVFDERITNRYSRIRNYKHYSAV